MGMGGRQTHCVDVDVEEVCKNSLQNRFGDTFYTDQCGVGEG